MMPINLPTSDELKSLVKQAVFEVLRRELPRALNKTMKKKWITTDEFMEITGWSRRTIQYLRDKRKIRFFQEGRRILYSWEDIERYLEENSIEPRSNREQSYV